MIASPTQSQSDKASAFLELHRNPKLLILPNIWDPIGARILQNIGYPAVATASAAISSSLGYRDDEFMPKSLMLRQIEQICNCVDVPITADIERGYGESLTELSETIHQLLEMGVIGINLQDDSPEGGSLRPIDKMCDRIAEVRKTAKAANVHLVINARIDTFTSDHSGSPEVRLTDTIERAKAYLAAGADCLYPMGPNDLSTVTALRDTIDAPLNILVSPTAISLTKLEELGINRVSFGPYLFRSLYQKFLNISRSLLKSGDFAGIGNEMMTREQIDQFLEG